MNNQINATQKKTGQNHDQWELINLMLDQMDDIRDVFMCASRQKPHPVRQSRRTEFVHDFYTLMDEENEDWWV